MITGVAIIAIDGRVISLDKPARHHNVIWYMINDLGYEIPVIGEQGFINEKGEFLNRKDAKTEALKYNQIIEGKGKLPELYSEDVWLGALDPNLPGGTYKD